MRTPNQRISVASRLSISTLLLLLLCAASSAAADASSAACSPNVASSFAPPLAAGTPASALCCSLPLFYTFTLPAPSAATLRATSSSASNATADDVIVTHELLGADGGRLFAAAQPATGDRTYNLDAGTYLVRVAATPLSRPAYFSFPVTLLLTTAAASGACAAADTNDTLDAPITQYPALINGSICPATDADTYGFYLDHPARLVFNTSDAIRVTANDSESGGAVIVGATEERRPVTVLFQPGNHLITVEAASNSFFSDAYTLSITEDNTTAIDPACNRSGSVRTSVTLPFQTSFTQCSSSDRAHFTFALPTAQLVAIQFAGAAPGIAALRTVTGELVAYAFQNGEASQSFYLPPGNYTLQVPAAADAQAASVAPLTDPQNVTVSINASSASCPDGAIAAAYDSADTVTTLPVNQQVTVCANSTEGLVAGAETTVWFAFDSAASRFTDATLPGSPTALASAAAYDITGSGYALPAVLPAGRFKLALVLARPLPTFVLNLTQVEVNVNGTFVELPASINATTNGAFPTQFFFTLPSAQRVTVTPQVAQDITAATGDNIVLPLRVRLFERCGWLDVCALYGDGRAAVPATEFYPGIFPTGRFSINLPLNQATNLDLARGTYGIELVAFAATPVNFSLTVSNGTDLACAADAVEPNDSPATAANFTLNSTVSATFCPINDRDFYLLTLPASQRVTIVYNGDVDSSLFVVNRLDAAQLMQLPTSAPSSLLLGAGAWLVLVAPPVSLVNSSTSLSAQAAYQLSINASDETCSTAPTVPAVASGLPFAGNLTQLCASAANTSFTLLSATVVDIIVLSPSRLPWVLSNATGAPIVATDEPKATVALLPGTYNVEVSSTVFNSSSFQLLIVATNASSAACLPDQFAANSNRLSAANVTLPFIAQLSSCGSSGTWFTFSLNLLSRLTITASRGAEAFAVAAAGETSNVWSTDVCFVAFSGNDTVPLFSSCGAAAHTLPPATYALNVQGSGAPFNLTVSAVPAVGVRQAGSAASLGASAALLVALSAVLAALL